VKGHPLVRSLSILTNYGVGALAYKVLLSIVTRIERMRRRICACLQDANIGKVVRNPLGKEMFLNPNDLGLSLDLLFDGIREPLATKTFLETVKPGDTVIDIGANIGYYTLLAAEIVGQEGKVYALEPVKETYEILVRNVNHNGYANVETFRCAVGDRNGTAVMEVPKNRNLARVTVDSAPSAATSETVEVITLDDFVRGKRFPNLIRMDVEGYEYNVILGMRNILDNDRPIKIMMEFHLHIMPTAKILTVLQRLHESGFNIRKIIYDIEPPVRFFTRVMDIIKKQFGRYPLGCGVHHIDIDRVTQDIEKLRNICAAHFLFERT